MTGEESSAAHAPRSEDEPETLAALKRDAVRKGGASLERLIERFFDGEGAR